MRNVLLHGHIFKNAGSSLDWCLQRHFGERFLDHRNDSAMVLQGASHLARLLNEQPGLQALSSHHLCYPLPSLEGVQLEVLFLLRHPLARAASAYAFERQQQVETPGAKAARRYNFRQYIAWRLRPEVSPVLRNYQALYLAGWHDQAQPRPADATAFALASQRLAQARCVGVVEQYQRSMVWMERSLGELFPGLGLAGPQRNAGPLPAGSEQRLSDPVVELGELYEEFLDHNRYDLALWEQASQRLEQAHKELPELAGALPDFLARCNAAQSGRADL
jgi:hypothetical protein